MATFFGEVLLQSSRAFWDGCDDIDGDADTVEGPAFQLKRVQKQTDESENELYDLIIFSTDGICSEFTSSCFLPDKSQVVATIEEVKQVGSENESGNQQKLVAELYKINNKILLFMCTTEISVLCASKLLDLVTPWLDKSKESIVLASNPVQDYKSYIPGRISQPSFLRFLKTKTYKEGEMLCPRLESPNDVTGFSAAVLSWCEIKDKPCVLYIYFYATLQPINNTVWVEPVYKLFERFKWYKQFIRDHEKVIDIKSIKIRNYDFESSNLYL